MDFWQECKPDTDLHEDWSQHQDVQACDVQVERAGHRGQREEQ